MTNIYKRLITRTSIFCILHSCASMGRCAFLFDIVFIKDESIQQIHPYKLRIMYTNIYVDKISAIYIPLPPTFTLNVKCLV